MFGYTLRLFSQELHLTLLILGCIVNLEQITFNFPFNVERFPSTITSSICFENSSLTCNYDVNSNKICSFHNIYFSKIGLDRNPFIAIINEYSKIIGLKDRNELKTINLSAVKNHQKMFMNIVVLDNTQSLWNIFLQSTFSSSQTSFFGGVNGAKDRFCDSSSSLSDLLTSKKYELLMSSIITIEEPTLVIRRFKCDNIMHVIHDDLLPLFLTYYHLCEGNIDKCISQHRLLFNDDCNSIEFLDLYRIFISYEPLFLDCTSQNLQCSDLKSNKLYWFKNLKAGIETSSVWYDYGFSNHHGPAKLKMDPAILDTFFQFLIKKLYIRKNIQESKKIKVLVLNRRINRRIINVSQFIEQIQDASSELIGRDTVVSESDLVNNTIKNLVEQILDANIIIGMHSSTMILSLFCLTNERATIFELFPFGIQPKYVSFLYPLEKVLHPKIKYKVWINEDKSNSIEHPEYPKLFGGINHLSIAEQRKILKTKLIPPVKCCHNPGYLFRMYQDTFVGQSFLKFYRESLKDMNFQEKVTKLNPWYYPAPVSNIHCRFEDSQILISWRAPINVFSHTINYKIAISIEGSKVFAYIVTENKFLFNFNSHAGNQSVRLSIWVNAFVQGHANIESTDTHVTCEEEK